MQPAYENPERNTYNNQKLNRKTATDLHLRGHSIDRIPYAKSFYRYFGQFTSIDQYCVFAIENDPTSIKQIVDSV